MTEKTEYITASIELLEKRDELNSDELAVLCNLKKFMYRLDHQPAFTVGEYSVDQRGMLFDLKANFKVNKSAETAIRDTLVEYASSSLSNQEFLEVLRAFDNWVTTQDTPATAEQIATFKRAEHFASKGRKLDEFKTDDVCIFRNEVVLIQELDNADDLWFYGNQFGEEYLPKEELKHLTLIQTAEELQEVENNE